MENNLKAAAIHRFSGWLGLIMTLLILIYTVSSHLGSITHVILLCILFLPVYLHFLIARGLVKRKKWAKYASIAMAFFMLLGFPIGTVLGIFLFIYSKWDYEEAVTQ
ncbi:hypothetical protein [Aquirhabdus sp.]|uniref:hypothetical protein n=1 Tax=Aquirhabdus sp. TaxID=2824160 RepID=UPI00396C9B92